MEDNKSKKEIFDFLKNFETCESFKNYCFSMPKSRIQKFSTNDWISFLYGVNHLAKNMGYSTTTEFMIKNSDTMGYMYSNFRPDKAKSRAIKNFAYKVADKLASSPEFAKLYYNIDIVVKSTKYSDEKAVKMMRKAIYDEYLGDNYATSILKPSVTLVDANSKSMQNAGYYKQGNPLTHEVVIKAGVVDFCNVAAHEFYHSLQHLGLLRRTKLLEKLGIKFNYNKQMTELYKLNHAYYLDYSQNLKGYKKQPLEYDARLFATCFERRLRKNLRASENNWSMLYQTIQLLRSMDFDDQNSTYTEDGIHILCNTSNKEHKVILEELKAKYLKDAEISKADENSVVLSIPRNAKNIINLNKLYTNQRKSYNNPTFKKDFIKNHFPISYNIFYATNREKNMQKPLLGNIVINRLYSGFKKR